MPGWIPRAAEYYAFPFRYPPVTSRTLEGLAAKGVPAYATREEAEEAVRQYVR